MTPSLLSLVLVALASVTGCTVANAQPPATAPASEVTAEASTDRILDALDRRGDTLDSFTADLRRTETDEALGDQTSNSGKLWIQRKPDGSFRVRALFDRKQVGKRIEMEKIEYLLDNGLLIDRNYRARVEVTRQVLRPGQKMDLFKLGEGPFPLPLGQAKEDVHQAFEVSRIDSKEDDPAGTVRIRLVPKPGTDLADKFKSIEAAVSVEQSMPVRIETVAPNDVISTFDLTNLKLNEPLTDADFQMEQIDKSNWNVVHEAFDR